MTNPPHDDTELPEGVGTVIPYDDGKTLYFLDPFLSEDRWPGVGIDSASFKTLSPPEKFFEQAVAFLQAAKVLCEAAGRAGDNLRWSQGSVCFYCLNLATELFLKACISRSKSVSAIATHELSKLLAQYAEILPAPEFRFPTPFLASAIEDAMGARVFNSIDRNPDQLYRYGVGRDGAVSAGVQIFNPGYIFNYLTYLSNVWQRAWDEISKVQG